MQSKTILFFGPSGSGKGTQAKLIKDYMQSQGGSVKSFSVGEAIRSFAKEDGELNKKLGSLINMGNLVPTFFPTWAWSSFFINEVSAGDDVVIEGIRRKAELQLFESLLGLANRKCQAVVLEISGDVAKERLLLRTRSDDGEDEIAKRMAWYAAEVLPAVMYADTSEQFDLVRINGEQSIKDIHTEIKAKLGLE